jgi:copper(I)-binding protein
MRALARQELSMIALRYFAVAAIAASLVSPAQAAEVTAGTLKISAPWARATPKGASVGGGYMTITNTGTVSDRLIGGASNISERFEVHEMSMDGGVMRMRDMAKGIEIKPGQSVEFKPGGYHVMFMGLKEQLMQGKHFKATLQFEKAGKVDVDFDIQGVGAQTGGGSAMPGMGGRGGMQMKH